MLTRSKVIYDAFKIVRWKIDSVSQRVTTEILRNESRLMIPLRINGRLETAERCTRKSFPPRECEITIAVTRKLAMGKFAFREINYYREITFYSFMLKF